MPQQPPPSAPPPAPPPRPSSASLSSPGLARRLSAEFLGTGLLVTVVVGSGIAAERLSPTNVGLQLLENSTATFLGLTVLILMFGPVSGAHFNPVVSAADWFLGKRSASGLSGSHVLAYTGVQTLGAIAGAELANIMFKVPLTELSTKERSGANLLVSEVVATAGLVVLIFALARTGRGMLAAPAVGAYIGAAYWFTSSTSFANPAVTIGRVFSDTFAGIAPASVPGFVVAQLVGGAVAVALVRWLYPDIGSAGDHTVEDIVVPHHTPTAPGAPARGAPPGEPMSNQTDLTPHDTSEAGAGSTAPVPVVVYVCRANGGRSAISRLLTEHYADGRVIAQSAGTEPGEHIHPEVARALREPRPRHLPRDAQAGHHRDGRGQRHRHHHGVRRQLPVVAEHRVPRLAPG